VCDLCPRECSLKDGDRGFCFVRENRGDEMVLTTYGRSTGFCIDPIEKKPLNHFYPGTSVLSFGTAGCNLGCKFCQNWSISKSREIAQLSESATPETIAQAARELACHSVAFTYNDPVIWAEYAIDVARACHAADVKTVAVTAGYITPEARGPFFEHIDAANVDLKAFTEVFYQHLTLSHLQPVLDTLVWLRHESDVWFEITNLVIPQENDSDDEFHKLCDFVLDNLGDDVPVHFTAFHPDFRMQDRPRTPIETLLRAYNIAKQLGLKHVYTGNVDDVKHQSTYCAGCGQMVIERNWYELGHYALEGHQCRHCRTPLAGHFNKAPGNWGRQRQPVKIANYHSELPVLDQTITETPDMTSSTQTIKSAEPVQSQPLLTPDQQQQVIKVASRIVTDAVLGRATPLPMEALGSAASQQVLGTFVTLKRQGRLRACCGNVGQTMRLVDSLHDAAIATATRDGRLPPISAAELAYLDVSVSLLHALTPVTSSGADRIGSVEVGRHGLQVIRGNARGLLLPSVATEHGMDAERFLDQVCIKANIPPKSWKEADTQLLTFEAAVSFGPFVIDPNEIAIFSDIRLLNVDQLRQLATHCLSNVVNMARGATPSYYLPQVPDGTVQGVAILLDGVPELNGLRSGQLSLRPGMPLQSTLLELCGKFSQLLTQRGLSPQRISQATLHLAMLSDPAMNATVAQPDLRGVDPQRRSVLVMERRSWAWVFDPSQSAEQLLTQAVANLGVQTAESATVLSLETIATTTPVSFTEKPRPVSGSEVRPAAVAGRFYPGTADEVDTMLDQLLPKEASSKRAWPAAMVPHAGWQFSGKIAAEVFSRIDFPRTIMILSPNHTVTGVEHAVAPNKTWQLPGCQIGNDLELAGQLVEKIPSLQFDAAAHASEHGIEVELPFVARLAPQSKVVGITIAAGNLQSCEAFANGLAAVLQARTDDVLLVISSDMNHFATDQENRRLDEMALAALDQLDPDHLFDVVHSNNISMCGLLPAVIVLKTLRKLDRLKSAQRVAYGTSADVSGDTSRVVGYAGMLFS